MSHNDWGLEQLNDVLKRIEEGQWQDKAKQRDEL